jgi:hypothetical protein
VFKAAVLLKLHLASAAPKELHFHMMSDSALSVINPSWNEAGASLFGPKVLRPIARVCLRLDN